jgi:glycosyltransferase involved in cell wall biosynthesis
MPSLSVLLPVRDAGAWLAPALESLWRQTHRDFEVIAVDDGSTDGSGERLERIAAREPRLRVVRTPPRGLPAALAAAHALARAPILARHDADDVSHRERFAAQLAFLRSHRDVAVVGARLRLFPSHATGPGLRRWARWHNALLTHDSMARDALIDSPLAHGTAMMRRGALERAGGWIERGWPEDVDLWLRMLGAGARLAKLPRVLYGWRQHASSATRRDPRYSPERFADLRLDALERQFLRRAPRVTLVAVGATLDRWSARLEHAGHRVTPAALGRPGARAMPMRPPIVLAFGAAPARERWRVALERDGRRELRDFVFIA